MNENSLIKIPEFHTIANSFEGTLENSKLPLDLRNLSKGKLKNGNGFIHVMKDGKLIKFWICGICNKRFDQHYMLLRHVSSHSTERQFRCTICGKGFRQLSTLYQHRAIHSSERPYVCDDCPKTFNRISTLISHRKTHVGIKPHKCNICNKAFHQKGNLRNHIFTHTNERPYKCDFCGKGFNQTSNLMCHKLKIHQENTRPNFVCSICGKEFFRRAALRTHEQNEHHLQTNSVSNLDNVIYVDAIQTKAMQRAIETNQIPFALFRPLNGIPILVKVLLADNNRHILVPTTAGDLKKYGKIAVTDEKLDEDAEEGEQKIVGCTVQIKIPVVATIKQQADKEKGQMTMSIINQEPWNKENLPANFKVPVSANIENIIEILD